MSGRLLVACICVAGLLSSHEALGNSRKGLLFGFGIGGGIPSFRVSEESSSFGFENQVRVGLATSLRFGYGFNERLEAFLYSNGVTALEFYWIPIPITTSVTGVGLRYYFPLTNSPNAFYAGLGSGLAAGSVLLPMGAGLGITAEGGYAFGSQWDLGLQFNWLNLVDNLLVDSDTGEEVTWGGTFSVAARISYTIY